MVGLASNFIVGDEVKALKVKFVYFPFLLFIYKQSTRFRVPAVAAATSSFFTAVKSKTVCDTLVWYQPAYQGRPVEYWRSDDCSSVVISDIILYLTTYLC